MQGICVERDLMGGVLFSRPLLFFSFSFCLFCFYLYPIYIFLHCMYGKTRVQFYHPPLLPQGLPKNASSDTFFSFKHHHSLYSLFFFIYIFVCFVLVCRCVCVCACYG
ncbi:hypothetical protein BC829DRAFT_397230, partial [Chytridium lagenaria]